MFGEALAAAGDAIAPDAVVLVRGRLDHRDRDKTCIVVQKVERFEPSAEEVEEAAEQAARRPVAAAALRLRLDAASFPATILNELKEVLAGFPGESDVVIELSTSVGARKLKLGPRFRVARSAGLHAELDALLGSALPPTTRPDGPASVVAGAV